MDASSYEEFEKISAEMASVKKRVQKVVKAGRKASHSEILQLTEICEGHVRKLEDLERRLERGDEICEANEGE